MVTNGVSPCSVMSFFCTRSRRDEQPSEEEVDVNEVSLEGARSQKQKEDELLQAIRDNNIVIIKELIANGLNVQEIRERRGKRTVLHCLVDTTCTEDDLQQMFELFLSKGCSVDAIDESGNTPIKLAAEKENLPLIRLLAKAGADVNIPDKLSGDTPLHWAAKEGKLKAVNMLIKEYDAAKDIQNNSKKSPLHVAVEERHKNVVLLLLHYNTNRKLRDQTNDYDPLTYARMENFNEIINIFNVPEKQIENRETMLKYAEEYNFAEVLLLFKKPPGRCDGIMEKVESDSPTNVESNVVNNYNYTVNVHENAKAAIGPYAKINIINQSNEDLEDSPAAATSTTTLSTPNATPEDSRSNPTAPPEESPRTPTAPPEES